MPNPRERIRHFPRRHRRPVIAESAIGGQQYRAERIADLIDVEAPSELDRQFSC